MLPSSVGTVMYNLMLVEIARGLRGLPTVHTIAIAPPLPPVDPIDLCLQSSIFVGVTFDDQNRHE
jgi:hypothetical protein